MKKFKKIVTYFLCLSFIITAAFFFAVLIVSFNRHYDGRFNTPRFENLALIKRQEEQPWIITLDILSWMGTIPRPSLILVRF